jgi:hypothetical protein
MVEAQPTWLPLTRARIDPSIPRNAYPVASRNEQAANAIKAKKPNPPSP